VALTERVMAWARRGRRQEFRGRTIHTVAQGGDEPPIVFLHGFPSSSYDFRFVIERLAGRSLLAFDFLGFGLSDKPRDHVYSLAWQADLTEELVTRAHASDPVVLVAHDMGTSVATELMARQLRGEQRIQVAAALLFNGSILLERASPTPAQKLLRSPLGPLAAQLSSRRVFRQQFGAVFSPAHPLSEAEADDQWALIRAGGGRTLGHKLVHYMNERERLRDRWHGAFRDWPGELRLLWGLRDPVATTAVLDGLRELRLGVSVTELPDVGHYPQLEMPDAVSAAVEDLRRGFISGSTAGRA
jgi:pimeloyl-ACP methyl ester carboxylesterase